jgi:rSAM/selenodomain-associated transferase 2/rSAM/selenodomain-associated transferase 1
MTEHIIARANNVIESRCLAVEVRFEGGNETLMRAWLGPEFRYRPQGEGDIGLRMERALAEGFEDDCMAVVLVGSDIPEITGRLLAEAFEGLVQNDLVLGPAHDGGYYLIGMRKAAFARATPQLFRGIDWGTEHVMTQTVAVGNKLQLTYLFLDTLHDVDRAEDVALWHQTSRPARASNKSLRISIIIPALNEAENIRKNIGGLPKESNLEIVVVDGGSQDNTLEVARSLGVKVVSTIPSKGRQMNAGAAEATGDVLVFLHADTRLPPHFAQQVRNAVNQKGFCAGAFKLGIESDAWGLRLIERVANWRSRYLQMPYGDQAIFTSRHLFAAIAGFPEIPIMEDFELVRRLRRKGKIMILDTAVLTSARRWRNLGILKTWILNQLIIGAYYLGISPARLARWYRRERLRGGK